MVIFFASVLRDVEGPELGEVEGSELGDCSKAQCLRMWKAHCLGSGLSAWECRSSVLVDLEGSLLRDVKAQCLGMQKVFNA
jgi:hypothetical protein